MLGGCEEVARTLRDRGTGSPFALRREAIALSFALWRRGFLVGGVGSVVTGAGREAVLRSRLAKIFSER